MVHLAKSPHKSLPVLAPLDRVGWLGRQNYDLQEWFATHGRWRNYAAGKAIYLHGDAPDAMYGLAQGAVEIEFAPIGSEPVTLHRAEAGFWIGESALLADAPRIISLCAAVDCRMFRVPATALRKLVAEEPRHWQAFYELTHSNTLMALTLLAEALSLTPRARLSRLLLRLSEASAEIHANQDDLGRVLGMTRSSLRRSLNVLIAERTIATGYGRITILDRERLKSFCDEA